MADRPTPLTRRALLRTAAGTTALAAVPASLLATTGSEALGAPVIAAVPGDPLAPIATTAPVRAAFAAAEQRFAAYLATLAGITNDIDTSADPDAYGWLAGGWSRTPAGPTNARVQEHVFSLSWFYANDRPWNPYFQDPALLARLDAALFHYLRLQHEDGSWPEYSGTEHGLAPTGFGLGYLAKTLANLRQADVLPLVRTQIETALSKGMGWLLNPANPIWRAPIEYTNQVTAGLAGATVALQLTPDPAMSTLLNDRMQAMAATGQSPAGFFYDPFGSDVNYNFEVMLPELGEIFLRTGSPVAATMAAKFATWFGYNLLREPDNSGWLTYYAVSARTASSDYDDVIDDTDRQTLGSAFVPAVPALAAFYTSREGKATARAAWAAQPGTVPALAKGNTSPRIIAHATYPESLPTEAQKAAAIQQLPYLSATDWAELRRDTATNQQFLYSRRPGYYVGAFFGTRPSGYVRAGTGFLWTPQGGTFIHAQQTDTGAWGTVLPGGVPDSATNLVPTYRLGSGTWNGSRVVPGTNTVTVDYRTPNSAAVTTLTLGRQTVTRAVRATTTATEQIPLVLRASDTVTWSSGAVIPHNTTSTATSTRLRIVRGGSTLTISWGTARPATLSTSSRTYLKDAKRRVHVLRIPHPGTLTVTYTLS
jgi:hypothetical protein